MTLNCPFQDDGAFDPDDIQHLADVFERACLALCNGRAQSSCIIRETIAARIIQAARNGEHDPEHLYAAAFQLEEARPSKPMQA
jgi:hypothetical protein